MKTIKAFDARSLAAGSLRGNVLGMSGLGKASEYFPWVWGQNTGDPSGGAHGANAPWYDPSLVDTSTWGVEDNGTPLIQATDPSETPSTPSAPAAKPSGGVSTTPSSPPAAAGMDWTPILIGAGILAVVGGGMWLYSGKR